jgi:hypothetical protein
VFGSGNESVVAGGNISNVSFGETTVGGDALAGVDFHVARWFSIGVNGGYYWMADFSRSIGARNNFSGAQFGVNFGFLFGKGR